MSNKSILEALAEVQRKVNEQRMRNSESNWNSIKEADNLDTIKTNLNATKTRGGSAAIKKAQQDSVSAEKDIAAKLDRGEINSAEAEKQMKGIGSAAALAPAAKIGKQVDAATPEVTQARMKGAENTATAASLATGVGGLVRGGAALAAKVAPNLVAKGAQTLSGLKAGLQGGEAASQAVAQGSRTTAAAAEKAIAAKDAVQKGVTAATTAAKENLPATIAGSAALGAAGGAAVMGGKSSPTASAGTNPPVPASTGTNPPVPAASTAPKIPGTSGATMPKTVPGSGATATGFGLTGPTSTQGPVASAPKPAAPKPTMSAPQARSTPAPAPKPDYGYARPGSDEDTAANFFSSAAKQQKAETGKKAPNDFSSETESGGKTKGKSSMKESTLIDAVLALSNKENMFEAAKKMKGVCPKCGKSPCQCSGDPKKMEEEALDEKLIGNQKKLDKNHNNKLDSQDFKMLRGSKKVEEESSSDPDFAAPRPGGEKKKGDIEFKPQEAPKSTTEPPKDAPMPPKKPAGLKEGIEFSEAELAHFASIFETAEAPTRAGTIGTSNQVPERDVIDEEEKRGRGRPKGSNKAEVNPNNEQGRDPRQHIQVIAGQAGAGRVMDFKHNNGEVSKITPAMGRRIDSHLGSLKPAEKQAAVNKMHDSAEGLKV
jgi:hypothetical protein